VTGASGFVGRHACDFLERRGHIVRRAGRRPRPHPVGEDWVTVGDLGESTDWRPALDGVEVVLHLAAHAHRTEERGEGDPEPYFRVNAAATRRLAEDILRTPGVRRLVFVSSVAAVRCPGVPIVDDSSNCTPPDPYGRSKRAAEDGIRETLVDGEASDWCIVRPPLVYGSGNPGNMARLLRLIHTGLPLPFRGIRNQRSLVFVGNLCDALERCCTDEAASRRTFLVADREAVSTPELVDRIGRICGRRALQVSVPPFLLRGLAAGGDLITALIGRSIGFDSYSLERLRESLVVDFSSIRDALSWEPPYTLDDGLRAALAAHEAA
jgi:nucleoside-diphosphate-sugar epimerase